MTTFKPPEATRMGASWMYTAAMLSDIAFETDVTGCFTAFGTGISGAETVLGFPHSHLLHTCVASLFTGHEGKFQRIFAAIREDRVGWHGKTLLRHADGTYYSYRLALAPIVNEANEVTGLNGLLINLDMPEPAHGVAAEIPEYRTPVVQALLCPETGLWSFDRFVEQAARRFDRLDMENLPGTLILLGFNGVRPNLRKPAAILIAEELLEIVRPTDILGRLGETTIAIWCDGMDHLTGGERAARLCRGLPAALPGDTPVFAGLATRWPASADLPALLIDRARLALLQAERECLGSSTGAWRVWQENRIG